MTKNKFRILDLETGKLTGVESCRLDLDSRLRNESEAALYLGISKQSLRRLRKANKIGYYRIGKRILYGAHHLSDFLTKNNQKGGQNNVA